MKTTPANRAAFGPYTLDLRSGELRKFGVRVKMGEQPLQILLMLLEARGEMVSREELRARLWVNDTFVDFDHGLNSAVQRLRDCLSDTAEKPVWIETIPRRGYRFIGQLDSQESAPSAGSSSAKSNYVPTVLVAQACARVGDSECVFEWLGKGFEERDDLMINLKVEPVFDGIRLDPRYEDLVRRVGIPE